jgi:glutamate synthase (NADPH/NADH) small chain
MGVEWLERSTPLRVLGGGKVEGLEISRPGQGEAEVSVLPVDLVVTAIGETATPPFAKELGLENVRKGEVRWLHMTAIENVFVAGDALSGPSKIGKAVYSGLRAARSLANWLDLKALDRLDAYDYNDLVTNEAGFGRQA